MKIFINDLNLKKEAEDLGVKIWQTPGFLFIVMGLVDVIVMAVTYYISKNYDNPEFLALAECAVSAIIIIVGGSVINLIEKIVKINKLKSEFVSIASHQLRTPLSAIRWETELLTTKLRKGLTEKQLENIQNIMALNQKMTRLVNDLLDVARIDEGRLILRNKTLNLGRVVEESFDHILPEIRAHHIETSLQIGKNLPPVLVDPDKIKLALDNLIGNAVKYTPSGGKIGIKLSKKEGNLHFEVKDSGVGIPEEQKHRVFEKFFRSDNAARYQTEGTGLGLYIAKNIVEQSGGKIWFESIENVGSLFGFSLPVCHSKDK